jgi:SAM-dependent methyltransferase
MDMWAFADRYIADVPPQDYVISNSLELFPDTLRVLSEWGRLLKTDGTLAVVCRDAEAYEEEAGPLENRHRCSCFTITTLRCYLARAGFEVTQWENYGKELRVAARRR